MSDKAKVVAMVSVFIGFCLGFLIGGIVSFKATNARLYDEARSEDEEIWVRIESLEGKKRDLFERLDKLVRVMDQYELAVAQLKVYEKRQEVMNVRLSTDD